MDIIDDKSPDMESSMNQKLETPNAELEIQNNEPIENSELKVDESKGNDDLKQDIEKKIPSDDEIEIDYEVLKVEPGQNNGDMVQEIVEKSTETNVEDIVELKDDSNIQVNESESEDKSELLNDVIEIESDQNDSNVKNIELDFESKGQNNENGEQFNDDPKDEVEETSALETENTVEDNVENDDNIVNIEDDSSSPDVQVISNEDTPKLSDENDTNELSKLPDENDINEVSKLPDESDITEPPKLEIQQINNNTTSKIIKNDTSLVDSIASEWNFSDGEPDSDPPKPSSPSPSPIPVVTTPPAPTNEKSSAEIIAMEWDDGSLTAAPNDNKIEENIVVENNTTEKKEENVEENRSIDSTPTSDDPIICTVIESTEENTEKTENDENIIILHDLSGLNLNAQNSGITIISVDENPDMNTSSSTTNENSYVIHELNIEPPNQQQQKTDNTPILAAPAPKSTEKRRPTRVSKYPYVVCSREEICKEIEQSRRVSTDIPPGGDVLFKNQIIKRLASKILPKNLNPTATSNVDIKPPVFEKPASTANSSNSVTTDQELLDILEGDADIDVYNLQKAKETHLAGDDSKILKADEITTALIPTSTSSRSKPKKLDPDLEREIALQQLSEMPDLPVKQRKGRNNNVVATNVPSTIIIEKTEKSVEGGDPFKFVENTKTVGTPSKYGPGSVKTYSRKSISTEPSLKDIVIPKELEQYIDFDKQTSSKRRKYNRKAAPQAKTPNKRSKKVEKHANTSPQEENVTKRSGKKVLDDNNEKESTREESKIFLTDNTSNVLISKRSRIIKRKIIWDPSLKAPTYVLPSVAKGKIQKVKNTKHLIPKKTLKSIGNTILKEEELSIKDGDESVEKKENINNLTNDETIVEAKTDEKKIEVIDEKGISPNTNKRKVDAIAASPSQTRKKKLRHMSEIDKLLMDEGAINMIYSVEQDEKTPLIRRQQRVISLDKFDKEIAKKKKMIMTALNTSPETASKALRKKDSSTTPPVRKKSHDSIRSSIQSPPPSPSSMFPPRAEASRIIRRHSSSSSFSSECMSPRRLSTVDTPGGDKSTKLDNSTTGDDDTKTVVNHHPAKKQNSTTSVQTMKKMRIMKIVQPRNLRRRGGVPIFIKKNKTNSYPGGSKSKYFVKKIENKIDGKQDEVENKETEQKQEKTSTETENNIVLRSAVQKPSKKETPVKSSSPTTESYQNIVKNLDNNEMLKKKDGDVEKQRTSSRQNAGTYNYKEISLRKYDELVQIIFTPQSSAKMKNSLNIQTMREFCDALATLKKDSSCKVVLITSTGSVFCRGLDYTPLIQQNLEKRKTIAQETANAVKEFVRAIVQFPRPVIAGVQGIASGLGVAILPLCDLVFVSDKATFSMNQCKLGCLPEGAASVSLPHVTSHAVAAELLIAGHKLTAMEALRHGLASRVLWPEGYFQELIPLCKAIASQSSQSMDSTKVLIRHSLSMKIEAALDSETHILIQHWISSECQQLLKKFVEQQD